MTTSFIAEYLVRPPTIKDLWRKFAYANGLQDLFFAAVGQSTNFTIIDEGIQTPPVILGYKSSNAFSSGYIYAPYQPLFETTIPKKSMKDLWKDFAINEGLYDEPQGILSRYAKKLAQGNYYNVYAATPTVNHTGTIISTV